MKQISRVVPDDLHVSQDLEPESAKSLAFKGLSSPQREKRASAAWSSSSSGIQVRYCTGWDRKTNRAALLG